MPAPAAPQGALGRAAPWLVAGAAYALLIVWLTWPLALNGADHLPDPRQLLGGIGWQYMLDIERAAWALAWSSHALVTAPRRPFEANIFHPAPSAHAYSEHFLGQLPVALPVYLASGNPVLVSNAVFLSAYLGCALAMHALVRRWTGSHLAAFGAGLTYAFSARRLTPSFSLQVVGAQYLPLVVLFSERWAERRRLRDLAAFGGCLLLQSLASYYVGYAAYAVGGVCLGVLVIRGAIRGRALVAALGVAAVAAATMAAISIPYLRLSAAGAIPPVELAAAEMAGLHPALLAPGGGCFPGVAVLALSLAGLAGGAGRTGARATSLALVLVGLVLALGPYARIGGWKLPLPYLWLHTVLPGFNAFRFPVRFLAIAEVGIAGLAGLGLAALARGRGHRVLRRIATGIALGALVAEVRSGARMALRRLPVGDAVPAVYRTLGEVPDDGVLLELPLIGPPNMSVAHRETLRMILSAYHWKRLVNGYSGYFPPTYPFLAEIAGRLPERAALQDLLDLAGVRWLIVHDFARQPAPGWEALERAGDVVRLRTAGDDVLYEVRMAARRDLRPRLRAAVTETPATTLTGTPLALLPASALRATWTVSPLPPGVRPRQRIRLDLTVENRSDTVWPGWGVRQDGLVAVEVRWTAAAREAETVPAATLRFHRDVGPGEAVTLPAVVRAPSEPGRYRLEALLRQMRAGGRASEPFRAPVDVLAPAAGSAPSPGRMRCRPIAASLHRGIAD